MKRTTVSMPDDLADALTREARRCRTSVSQITREALELRLGRGGNPREFPFIGLFNSGHGTLARDHEEILRQEFAVDRDR